MNHPLLLALMTLAGLYIGRLWWGDLRAARRRAVGAVGAVIPPGEFPGATPAPARTIVIAVAGALVLLGAETAGEFALGLAEEQSRMTALMAVHSIVGAPIIEELLFRGWLVLDGSATLTAGSRGRATMWAAAVGASAVFAALHPFLWRWDETGLALTPTAKGWFSTGAIFAGSLWFYVVRLAAWNPQRSLLPCFAAHAAKNLGVVVAKAAMGLVGGWW
ncbi:MAG: CPBP family intramembrane metalloprotease [Verrucomicrobia bacterium]|nr:CPBP family intramembrane metalloprotease [Verrucomicrobiota bacterium]